MDGGEEVSGGLVVARGDAAELLELGIEILDEMSRLVHLLVEEARDLAVAFRWDYRSFACRKQGLNHALVGIEGFVRQQSIGLHLRQQGVGAVQIVGLAWGQKEGGWIAQRIDQRMDFGAQSAFAAPDRFAFAAFFWAPALC